MAPTDDSRPEELDGATTADDPGQLEEASSVAAIARSSRPQRKRSEPVEGKGAPTPKRRAGVATVERRTTPAQFVNESVEELKKVVWPTPTQVRQYYWVVLVFVLAVSLFVALLDFAFGWVLLKLFA